MPLIERATEAAAELHSNQISVVQHGSREGLPPIAAIYHGRPAATADRQLPRFGTQERAVRIRPANAGLAALCIRSSGHFDPKENDNGLLCL